MSSEVNKFKDKLGNVADATETALKLEETEIKSENLNAGQGHGAEEENEPPINPPSKRPKTDGKEEDEEKQSY